MPENCRKDLLDILKGGQNYYGDVTSRINNEEIENKLNRFFRDANSIAMDMNIGVLENGTILFMYKQEVDNDVQTKYRKTEDGGYKIYWAEDKRSWKIEYEECDYYFELPDQLLKEWDDEVGNWNDEYNVRKRALGFKEKYFPKVILYKYNYDYGTTEIKIIEISQKFLKRAAERIENQFREE
jgi:hypothetical protein